MSKVTIIAAGAVGYVLGARAGRERYDQIVATTNRILGDPRVQRQKAAAVDAIKANAPAVGATVLKAAMDAGSKAADAFSGDDDPQPEPLRDEHGRFVSQSDK